MIFLLTSAGFTNRTISNALLDLTRRPFKEISLAFIPTAANMWDDDKSWLIDDLYNTKKLGFSSIDIVDISALPNAMWEKRLNVVDIIMVGGGNTYDLIYWINKSGFSKTIEVFLKTKVYVGISAGSIVMAKNLALSQSKKLYYEDRGKIDNEKGLGFVDFHIRPHLNSPDFPNVREKYLKEQAKKILEPIYAIDDDTAIKVVNGKIEVISEGKWIRFN